MTTETRHPDPTYLEPGLDDDAFVDELVDAVVGGSTVDAVTVATGTDRVVLMVDGVRQPGADRPPATYAKLAHRALDALVDADDPDVVVAADLLARVAARVARDLFRDAASDREPGTCVDCNHDVDDHDDTGCCATVGFDPCHCRWSPPA